MKVNRRKFLKYSLISILALRTIFSESDNKEKETKNKKKILIHVGEPKYFTANNISNITLIGNWLGFKDCKNVYNCAIKFHPKYIKYGFYNCWNIANCLCAKMNFFDYIRYYKVKYFS